MAAAGATCGAFAVFSSLAALAIAGAVWGTAGAAAAGADAGAGAAFSFLTALGAAGAVRGASGTAFASGALGAACLGEGVGLITKGAAAAFSSVPFAGAFSCSLFEENAFTPEDTVP